VPLFRITTTALEPIPRTTFAAELVQERADLQRLLRQNLALLDDDLLFVAEEYSSFQDSKRRVDLLALDRSGQLVVIELKRTDDGGHMELQALRYAAMVSTMTYEQLIATYAEHNHVTDEEARQAIEDWLEVGQEPDGDLPDVLPDRVRIILVSANFSPEVTSTVLWLNANYGLDIVCHRLVPYRHGDDVLIDIQQFIPLPEAADFLIKQRDKDLASAAARERASTKDYTKYDVSIDGITSGPLSKQAAIRHTVRRLVEGGIPGLDIRTALTPKRWVPVTRLNGESVKDAYQRQYPHRGIKYWFDIGMREGDVDWVMPRLGGLKTEEYLAALAALGGAALPVSWTRVESTADED
jgi:hypothetical protein